MLILKKKKKKRMLVLQKAVEKSILWLVTERVNLEKVNQYHVFHTVFASQKQEHQDVRRTVAIFKF